MCFDISQDLVVSCLAWTCYLNSSLAAQSFPPMAYLARSRWNICTQIQLSVSLKLKHALQSSAYRQYIPLLKSFHAILTKPLRWGLVDLMTDWLHGVQCILLFILSLYYIVCIAYCQATLYMYSVMNHAMFALQVRKVDPQHFMHHVLMQHYVVSQFFSGIKLCKPKPCDLTCLGTKHAKLADDYKIIYLG